MNRFLPFSRGSLLGLTLLVAGCSTTGAGLGGAEVAVGSPPAAARADEENSDPLEGFNRAMYTFNDNLDVYVLKPVAKGYRAVLPGPVRTGVSNFFGNLHDPVIALNNLLQGKFENAVSDAWRFVANTTVGIYGLFDVASELGLEKHHEDFGQTLGKWGAGEGVYVVWPFFGPSTLRDTGGDIVDWQFYPPNRMEEGSTRDKLYALEVVNRRAQLLDASDILEQAGGQDPYVFVREAFRQRRKNLIYDGNPPTETPDAILFEDDKPAPAKPAPAKPKQKPAKPPAR